MPLLPVTLTQSFRREASTLDAMVLCVKMRLQSAESCCRGCLAHKTYAESLALLVRKWAPTCDFACSSSSGKSLCKLAAEPCCLDSWLPWTPGRRPPLKTLFVRAVRAPEEPVAHDRWISDLLPDFLHKVMFRRSLASPLIPPRPETLVGMSPILLRLVGRLLSLGRHGDVCSATAVLG